MVKSAYFPKDIYGIDFSGALDAGKKIWIAKSSFINDVFIINECLRADSLPESGKERNKCLKSICTFIKNAGSSAFGMDFPFGLPASLISDKSWLDFVRLFSANYSNDQDFRNKCRIISNGLEIKRVTDKESKAPFSPYNLRIYRQTFFGICNVLAPLVEKDLVRVLPMQKTNCNKPWIIEVCPASILKQKKLYFPYKGKTRKHYKMRAHIMKELVDNMEFQINLNKVYSVALKDSNGDALDSIIAAIATFRAINFRNNMAVSKKKIYAIEGYVYV